MNGSRNFLRRTTTYGLGALLALTGAYALQIFDWRYLPIQVPMLAVPMLLIFSSCWYYTKHRVRVTELETCPLSVDVFVTSCGEDLNLIRSTLLAAREMRGEHETWLLDDANSPECRAITEELGVGYLTRNGCKDFKAGNINAALAKTSGDVIVIFDVDHRPQPEFLERALPHFADPGIGFVQVMLTFSNRSSSWTARAAIETTHEYFNLISPGKDAYKVASLMGSNALIRRSALKGIGGYRPGLAEDLETSIALHADGWHSAYVAEPLAPGLAPEDYRGFVKQQAKWSRGVMEAALRAMKGPFWALNSAQKAAYLLRFSYYLAAPTAFCGSMVAALCVMFNLTFFEGSLRKLLPFLLVAAITRTLAHRSLAITPEARTGILMRGNLLVIATWPAYLRSLWATIWRSPTTFVATPKSKSAKMRTVELLPQLAALCFTIAALSIATAQDTISSMPAAAGLCVVHVVAYTALLPSLSLSTRLRRAIAAGKFLRFPKAIFR